MDYIPAGVLYSPELRKISSRRSRSGMRYVCQLIFFLLSAAAISSQETTIAPLGKLDFETSDCGNPARESNVWLSIDGMVTRILGADTVELTVTDTHETVEVHLVAISPAPSRVLRERAKQYLSDALMGHAADVLVNPSVWAFRDPHPRSITGVIFSRVAPLEDISKTLLANGLATFKNPPPYSASEFTLCKYRQTQSEAESKHVGVWKAQQSD